ncbi:MAG: FimV/HubP family polar landmark protein [Methylophilus sp.]|nr:FimV/HubP family polar landmark protein [Methylophilus sp.]
MHSSKLKYIAFAICLILFPFSIYAAGLGKLNVISSLGEPLKADIELLSVTAEELSSINATIAPSQAYQDQGLEKPASHNDIKIEVAKNARGTPILKLRSAQPITDAFLDMLIQVDWSSGRLLREYTVLLDPPGYTGEANTTSQPSAVQSPKTSADKNKETSNSKESVNSEVTTHPVSSATSEIKSSEVKPLKKSKGHQSKSEQSPPPEVATESVSGQEQITTARGDTLSKLAHELKPEGVSLEQMLVGLYQENPQAFDGENMNRLKVGQIVRVPSQETLQGISKSVARKEVRVHAANWNAYKNRLAGIVEESAGSEAAVATQSSSGKVMTEDKAATVAKGPKDVVKLSAVETPAKTADDKVLKDKVAALQEEVTAKDNALKEAESKKIALEKQVENMQKLIALKNDAMTKLQSESSAKTSPEPEKTEPEVKQEVSAVAPEMKQEATVPTPPAPDATPVEQPKKPKVTTPAPSAPVEEPSTVSTILQNVDLNTLGLAGGGLLLLTTGLIYLRNKRKKNLASFEDGIMTSGGLKANTVFGNTAGGTVDTGDTSFLTDFSQSTAGGMIDSHDVDPIAEAEVYMAYGRDAQAEEILKDAIVKEPKRYELHLKLLEIYQAANNTSAFEAISGELYTSLGANDPTWNKVAQLGLKLDPQNPLYQNATEITDPEAAQESSAPISKEEFFASFGDAAETSEATAVPEVPDGDGEVGDFAFTSADEPAIVASDVKEEAQYDLNVGGLDFDMEKSPEVMPDSLESAATLGFELESDAKDLNQDTVRNDFSLQPEVKDVQSTSLESAVTRSLDVPTIDFPITEVEEKRTDSIENIDFSKFTENVIEEPSNDFGITLDAPAESVEPFELDVTQTEEMDEPEVDLQNEGMSGTSFAQPASMDLSEISLDLNDTVSDATFADLSEAHEPEEVETKLDLVMAYLDMEDKIGAKELLEEVLNEGGENQRKRAAELLAKIA